MWFLSHSPVRKIKEGSNVTLSGANRTMTVTANTLTLNGVVSGAFSLTKGGVARSR